MTVFSDLEAIRAFLADVVVDQVPPQLRAEVRAASKVLREIALEIDALPALLSAQCAAMLALCDQVAAEAPGLAARMELDAIRGQLAGPMAMLSEQLWLHALLEDALGHLHLAMIARFDAAPHGSAERADAGHRIAAINALHAAQADARMPWQSVFPALKPHTGRFDDDR